MSFNETNPNPNYEMILPLLLNTMALDLHQTAVDHGFYDTPPNKGEKIALMHSELSELLEAERSTEPVEDKHCPGFSSAEIEAADLLIRLLDYCATFGYDIGRALIAKGEFNKTRERKHGKEF